MTTHRSRSGASISAALLFLGLHWPFTAMAGVDRWTAIGPDGANVVALAFEPGTASTAYAGTSGGAVLKTTDSGAAWSNLSQGLANAPVFALAVDPASPSTVYAGTQAGLFRSVDGAAHWTPVGIGGASPVSVVSLAIDPVTPAVVYAATSGGLFKSIDRGANWSLLNTGVSGVRLVAVDPTSHGTLYVGVDDPTLIAVDEPSHCASSGICKSTDAGATWSQIFQSPTFEFDAGPARVVAFVVDPRTPSRMYVGLLFGGVWKSDDGGAHWSRFNTDFDVTSLAIDPASSDTLYVGTDAGSLLKSTDGGRVWSPKRNGLHTAAINVLAMAASGGASILYAGASNDVFETTNQAQSWTRVALGVRAAAVNSLAIDPFVPSTIYARAEGTVMKTTDGGAHWLEASHDLPVESVALLVIDPITPSTLYAGSDFDFGDGALHKSVDGGANWSILTGAPVAPGPTAISIAPSQPSTLFIGVASHGVSKSTDGGATWTAASNGLTASVVGSLAVDPTTADTVYAVTPPTNQANLLPRIFKSTDGAGHWRQLPLALPAGTLITRLAIDPGTPSTIYVTYIEGGSLEGGVIKSIDGGETWPAPQSPSTGPTSGLAIDPVNPMRIYAATSTGVYRSTDGAATWSAFNAGLPATDVSDIAIDHTGSLLRIATPTGLFEYQAKASPASGSVPVIEYYNGALDHYFITSIADEIAKLDRGIIAGWTRTGLQFNAYAAPATGTAPVCRFFSTAFGPGSSHFYSPFESECAKTRADLRWSLESSDVFDIDVASGNGTCNAGLVPVYRLYNNGQGGAPNHRYTTDRAVRQQMIDRGWVPEGLGPDGVQMCSPS